MLVRAVVAVVAGLHSFTKARAVLQMENIALRHQLSVLRRRTPKRQELNTADRLFWIGISRLCSDWRSWLIIVQPETVVGWAQEAIPRILDMEGTCGQKSQTNRRERNARTDPAHEPRKPNMGSSARPWRASKTRNPDRRSSVSKYLVRPWRQPSQTWRTFLENHIDSMVSVDFFTVPTIRFQVLYVFLVLAHQRRRIIHFGVTPHPTAEWTAQQLREAFPWDSAPSYLLRDRDSIFGRHFVDQVKAMGIKEVLSAPRSPWQRAYVERIIGTVRRECLDQVIVFGEGNLRAWLKRFIAYYHQTRTHLALDKDAPETRTIQHRETGPIVAIPEVGGLHHRYERRAA